MNATSFLRKKTFLILFIGCLFPFSQVHAAKHTNQGSRTTVTTQSTLGKEINIPYGAKRAKRLIYFAMSEVFALISLIAVCSRMRLSGKNRRQPQAVAPVNLLFYITPLLFALAGFIWLLDHGQIILTDRGIKLPRKCLGYSLYPMSLLPELPYEDITGVIQYTGIFDMEDELVFKKMLDICTYGSVIYRIDISSIIHNEDFCTLIRTLQAKNIPIQWKDDRFAMIFNEEHNSPKRERRRAR